MGGPNAVRGHEEAELLEREIGMRQFRALSVCLILALSVLASLYNESWTLVLLVGVAISAVATMMALILL
jgi:hypothetical protein